MPEFKDAIQNPTAFFDSESLRIGKLLEHGQEITIVDEIKMGIRSIMLVGNSKLNPENFSLRSKDYQAIPPLVYPGKSAMLDFLRLDKRGTIYPKEKNLVSQLTFGKDSDRKDGIYIAEISAINEAGFEIYFAPVKTNGLHIRLVYQPFTSLDYPVLNDLPSIPKYPLERLTQIWRKVRLLK